jgi:Mrp family chromosome partitioning ATPase
MSRVYNVMTGAARPSASPGVAVPDEGAWENSEEAAFIEVGAPGGPIFFSPPSAAVAAAIPRAAVVAAEPKPATTPAPARGFPRLAPATDAPAYLSIRFHELPPAVQRPGDGPDRSLVALHFPEHPTSGEYRAVRDAIRKQLPDAGARVLILSAAALEAGTTTVLLNLSITLAREPQTRVLIVDANLDRPAVASRLAAPAAPGLCEAVAGEIPLAWSLQPSPLPTLQVLTCGKVQESTPALLAREFPRLLTQLRQWFDWVLVDSGLWNESTASPACDAIYLVTREADANHPEFIRLRDAVRERGGLLRGYIATRV